MAITVFRDKQDKIISVEISDKAQSPWEDARKWVYFPKDNRPWIGVALEQLNPQLAEYFGTQSGVLIKEVLKDSPAKKAELRAGDVIVAWNGEKIENTEQLFKHLDASNPEDQIRMIVKRKGKKREVRLTLGQPNPEASRLYELSKKGLGSDKGDYKHRYPGMELPMLHQRPPHEAFKYTEDRLTKIEKQIQDLAGELRRLVEKLDAKISEEAGKQ